MRSIFCILQKAEPKWWTKLLRGDGKAPHYVKVDWDKWVDEDDEPDAGIISIMICQSLTVAVITHAKTDFFTVSNIFRSWGYGYEFNGFLCKNLLWYSIYMLLF